MVRIASADTFRVIHLSSSARKKRLVCKFGLNLRLVLMLEWLTWWPVIGFLPVTWHTLAMILFFSDGKGAASASNNKMIFEVLQHSFPDFFKREANRPLYWPFANSFLRILGICPKKPLLAIELFMSNNPNISFLGSNLDFLDHPVARDWYFLRIFYSLFFTTVTWHSR